VIAHTGSAPRAAAAALIAIAGAAWWVTIANAREMSDMLDGFVKVGRAVPWDISPVAFAGTWTVMMTAMMLPGVIPVVMAAGPSTGAVRVAAYLGVWVSTGAIAFGALVALNEIGQPSPGLHRAGGALIVLAGIYQFTGWKRRLLQRPDPGARGLSHGLRCLGASWALMSVLLVVGVMNVVWMAVVSAICLGEKAGGKASPRRPTFATVVGVVLVGCGLVVLIEPRMLVVIAGTG
jgi:predicted metal-binding membrane protein